MTQLFFPYQKSNFCYPWTIIWFVGPKDLLDSRDVEKQQTALHKAAWYMRRTICAMLVEAGAALTITDYQGNTPRIQALKAEDTELASYLESKEDSAWTDV